jgi:hypothetical protein
MIEFDEEYFTKTGYINYSNFPHFKARADYIRDLLNARTVVVLGGAFGYLVRHLLDRGIQAYNIDNSAYCYEKKVIDPYFFIKGDISKLSSLISLNSVDWIVSWNVLDCLNDLNSQEVFDMLNSIKVNQLHVVTCDSNNNSADYKKEGYFVKSHEYWKEKLPLTNLICSDCRKVIQGYLSAVPLNKKRVSD